MKKAGSIVHVTSTHRATDGRIFYRECRSLQGAGWDVRIVAHGVPLQPKDGIGFVEFPKSFSRVAVLMKPHTIVRFLDDLEADVYHFHDPDLLLVAGLLAGRRKKIVYDCHEWYQKVFPYKGYSPLVASAAAAGLSLIEMLVMPRLSALIAPTDELAALYAKRTKRVYSIRNFAPLEGWELSKDKGNPKRYDLIHVGTVSLDRLNFMLDIVRTAKRLGREITLCLLGVSTGIKQHVDRDDALKGLVEAIERVPETKVPEFLSKARIGFNYHPYQSRFIVAIPMKVFEYMRHGLPFVSTALPPLKKLLEDSGAGVLIEENTVNAFIKVIGEILRNGEMMAQMGNKGTRLVRERYNWEAESIKLVTLYESLFS